MNVVLIIFVVIQFIANCSLLYVVKKQEKKIDYWRQQAYYYDSIRPKH